MGGAYAASLAAAGYAVIVVDPDEEARRRAVDAGCTVAVSVDELVAAGCNPVLLSLATDDAFNAVVADLAAACGRRTESSGLPVVADTSTLGVDVKERGRQTVERVGVILLDCPVSGTGEQARTGDLVVYASGPDDAVNAVEPVFRAFARRVIRVGGFGAGMRVKLLANLLVGIHNAAAAEMLALAERAGVDLTMVIDAVVDGAGQSRMLEVRGPHMASHDYGYGATVDLFRKDLRLINDFARGHAARTPLLEVVTELYEQAASIGLGSQESAAVHAVYLDNVDP
jgi:3-hydroxyisobutyrate dehydrogenase-like beta-hydroxyacid dehydrogenase